MKNRVLQAIILIIGCTALGVVTGLLTFRYYQDNKSPNPQIEGLLWPNPKKIEQFNVVDQDGKNFSMVNLSGKWSFLFFGYTHCPDICPVTLSVLDQVYKKLAYEKQADDVQIIFVSVDPERDTPDVIKSYVNYFNKNFIGLTGSEEQIDSITRQIGIVHARTEKTAPGEYLVDHTASVFLISPDDKLLGIFSVPHNADDIISRYRAISNFFKHMKS